MSRYGMAAFELKPDVDDAGFDHAQVCDVGIIRKLRRSQAWAACTRQLSHTCLANRATTGFPGCSFAFAQ